MKIRKKVNKLNKESKFFIIKKSVTFAVLISILIPSFLIIIKNIFLSIFSNTQIHNFALTLQLPAFLEFSMLDISILWLIIRFIPIVAISYFNGILLDTKLARIKRKNTYLIISSIAIYFLSLIISILIFDLLTLMNIFELLPEMFDLFDI